MIDWLAAGKFQIAFSSSSGNLEKIENVDQKPDKTQPQKRWSIAPGLTLDVKP